jgi:LysM repeat protein
MIKTAIKYFLLFITSVITATVFSQNQSEIIYHIVKSNESAISIAREYHIALDSLKSWNKLNRNYRLEYGQKIIIQKSIQPGKITNQISEKDSFVSSYHIVEKYENCYTIASIYETPVDSIKKWNKLDKNALVQEGQQLIISKLNVKGKKYAMDHPNANSISRASVNNTSSRNITGYFSIFSDNRGVVTQNQTTSLIRNLFNYFKKSHLLLKVIIIMVLFYLFSVITLFLFITLRRIYTNTIKKKKSFYTNRYSSIITEYLYAEPEDWQMEILKKELENRLAREVFLSLLLSLKANFTGESSERLTTLYLRLHLKEYSIRKVHHSGWHIKAKGFRELSAMNITDINNEIALYLNHRNIMLRVEARIAWIKLNPDDRLNFLNNPNIQLTEWGQLNAFLTLKNGNFEQDFAEWLSSRNRKVACYALKMTGILKQIDNIKLVIKRLDDDDELIRREAIVALGKFEMKEAVPKLTAKFPNESLINKCKILRALISISDTSTIGLFKEVLTTEINFDIQLLAAKGLFSMGHDGKEFMNKISLTADHTLKSIIKHASDTRI